MWWHHRTLRGILRPERSGAHLLLHPEDVGRPQESKSEEEKGVCIENLTGYIHKYPYQNLAYKTLLNMYRWFVERKHYIAASTWSYRVFNNKPLSTL